MCSRVDSLEEEVDLELGEPIDLTTRRSGVSVAAVGTLDYDSKGMIHLQINIITLSS